MQTIWNSGAESEDAREPPPAAIVIARHEAARVDAWRLELWAAIQTACAPAARPTGRPAAREER